MTSRGGGAVPPSSPAARRVGASSRSESVGWRRRSSPTSAAAPAASRARRSAHELAGSVSWSLRGAARAHEVRVVGVRQAVGARRASRRRPRAPRGEHGVAGAGERRGRLSIASAPFAYATACRAAVATPERSSLRRGDSREERRALGSADADLQVRRRAARSASRAPSSAPRRYARAAARAGDDPPRRPLERRRAAGSRTPASRSTSAARRASPSTWSW